MNSDQLFEELAKRWPDLIQKSQQQYLGVDEGWFNIIDILCGAMSYDVQQARYKLKYAMENQGGKYAIPISEAEANLAEALDKLPTIAQIKEKFGSLRFYVYNASEKINNYITFAEAMSSRTCEVCGSPGSRRDNGWIKTLCDKHHKEQEEKNSIPEYIPKKTTPSFEE